MSDEQIENMARALLERLLAQRDESYAKFWYTITTKATQAGIPLTSKSTAAMRRAYEIGYVDAINDLLDQKLIRVEVLPNVNG